MKKIAIAFAAIVGMGMAGLGTTQAQAAGPFGFHIGGRGFHVAIGNVHRQTTHRPHYRSSHGRGHWDYHDTTHLDWHPAQLRRHGNHFHYTPGHYDVHRTGHFDYHRGGHFGGHSGGYFGGHSGGHFGGH
jgi:hypothetical protein